jgi:hypothetical protein
MLFVLYALYVLLQVVHDKDTQTLLDLIGYALGPAAGVVVNRVVAFVLQNLQDGGHPASPFAARWLTWAITAIVPTILYALYVLLSQDAWNWATWLLDVLMAFGVATQIHGQTDLPRVPVKQVPLTEGEILALKKGPASNG